MLGLLWSLIRGALLLLGHLSGGGSFPKPLSRQEEAQALAAMQAGLKVGAWIVFSIIALLYLLFGLIF